MFNALPHTLRSLPAVVGAALLLAVTAAAQQPPPARDYAPSDATGEVLPKYKVAVEAKNYDAAIALLDGQLAKVPADSYDAALLYQIKTQTLLQKGDFVNVIDPLEKGLALSDSKTPTYYEERATRDLVFFLAQLYLQEAVQAKDKVKAAVLFEKADNTMARWISITPKRTADGELIYSQLLYNRALVKNQDHPDLAILQRALNEVDIGLHLSTHPKDTFYVLKLVCLQQLNRNPEATEILELLVKQKPDSATYWQQLASLYLASGQDIRAILSIERAQSHGLMNTPKDNFNLIGIYFNLGQYEKASELLETGLHNGTIENDLRNWELLANTYQQLERPYKGIETLKDATKAFPKSGQLEYLIAQAYYGVGKPEDALPHLHTAIAKGGLAKPHQVYSFMAYMAYELKKFDEALEAAQNAVATPEGAKDVQAKNLLKGIQDIIKEREAKKDEAKKKM